MPVVRSVVLPCVRCASFDFVRLLLAAPIQHIALENPVSIISSRIRKPDQVIQPWQHGHGETKATCLWLKNLPRLIPTNMVEGREQRIWKLPPSADRWKERSRTYEGIALAFASQWGDYVACQKTQAKNCQPVQNSQG